MKKGDDVVAFANLWPTDLKDELSIDLMRHDDRSPSGTMDFLFAELMLWGKAQGYRWFSLGMAPMSGLEDGPLSPWWSRAFSLVFRHGEARVQGEIRSRVARPLPRVRQSRRRPARAGVGGDVVVARAARRVRPLS